MRKSFLLITISACSMAILAMLFIIVKHQAVAGGQKNKEIAVSSVEGKKVAPKDLAPFQTKNDAGTLAIPILMYHHVGDLPVTADSIRRDLTVSTAHFEEQVAWIAAHGYTVISLEELSQYFKGNFTLPKKPLIFTFDDGYEDVFINAVPVLQKYGYTGSFAVITGFVGQPEYASWDQLEIAHRAGMDLVSHTATHFDGSDTKYDDQFIKNNIAQSELDFAKHGIINTHILIYPYGHYTPAYITAAQAQGIDMALTVHFGSRVDPKNVMEIPRVRVHGEEDLATFEKNLQ